MRPALETFIVRIKSLSKVRLTYVNRLFFSDKNWDYCAGDFVLFDCVKEVMPSPMSGLGKYT